MKTVTTEAARRAFLSFSAHLVTKKATASFSSSYSETAPGKEREVVTDFFAGGAVSSGRQLTPRSSITRRAPTTVMLLRAHLTSASRSWSAFSIPRALSFAPYAGPTAAAARHDTARAARLEPQAQNPLLNCDGREGKPEMKETTWIIDAATGALTVEGMSESELARK